MDLIARVQFAGKPPSDQRYIDRIKLFSQDFASKKQWSGAINRVSFQYWKSGLQVRARVYGLWDNVTIASGNANLYEVISPTIGGGRILQKNLYHRRRIIYS